MLKRFLRSLKGCFTNKVRKKGDQNEISINKSLFRKTLIEINGDKNKIESDRTVKLSASTIKIIGNNNKVELLGGVSAKGLEICIEDDNNHVLIMEDTRFSGKIHIACIEGTSVRIGKNCLFSSDIVVRTGDSHSILDMQGKRINLSKDVIIGNHVWVGNKVTINKGVVLPDESVVGTGAVITKSFDEKNSVIAGVPAVVVKKDITWCSKRI